MCPLSTIELQQLDAFKLRRALEARGFDHQTAARLVFLRWRYETGRLNEWRDA